MKETTWNDCLIKKAARKITPDIQRAKSLTQTAQARMNLVKEINEQNCNFVFEDYYTSLLELLQATAFKAGYNVLNHICIGFYLRDVLTRQDLYIIFDDLRYKRNSLTYYGKMMEFDVANHAIEKCKQVIVEIQKVNESS